MTTNCYQIAFEQATREIAAIDAEIRKLTRRKELLEKLLEPLKLLVPEFGSFATHVTVLDNNLPYSEVATQVSPVMLMKVSEPEGSRSKLRFGWRSRERRRWTSTQEETEGPSLTKMLPGSPTAFGTSVARSTAITRRIGSGPRTNLSIRLADPNAVLFCIPAPREPIHSLPLDRCAFLGNFLA